MALLNQRLQRLTQLVDLLDQRRGISLATTVPYQTIPRLRSYHSTLLHWLLLHNNLTRAAVQRSRSNPS